MVRRIAFAGLPVMLVLAGCLQNHLDTPLVPANPFTNEPAAAPPAQASYTAASNEAATRVGLIGQKLVAANPQIAVRPTFRVVGSPQAEVFHRGTAEILITEGLVKLCSEGQLAAVLSVEMGKIVSERDAQASVQARTAEREPPPALSIGGESMSSRGPADMTRMAELAPYDRQRRLAASRQPPADPQVLARNLLMKAGYSAADLEAAQPLLHAASGNVALEKQLTSPASRNWQH